MSAYQLGTGVVITENVSVLGVPMNPTTAVFVVELPDNSTVTYTFGVDAEVTHPAVGQYVLSLTAAQVPQSGQYHYKFTGTGAVEVVSEGDFYMLPSSVGDPVPVKPQMGPCETWCDSADVVPFVGNVGSIDLTKYAVEASQLLYELSGRLFTGTCRRIVRPCGEGGCGGWRNWVNSVDIGGTIYWLGAWWGYSLSTTAGMWNGGDDLFCGCQALDRVRLDGFPVWDIVEVKIDGAVVDPDTYRLDDWEHLVRVRPLATDAALYWPACQNMDLPGTETGTFEVTYLCGVDPPPLGKDAAAQLAAQLYFAGSGGDCQLPVGATQVIRQGVTISRSLFPSWVHDPQSGWNTGLVLVDAFLNQVNPYGSRRRGSVYSPDVVPYAPQLGSIPGGS